MNGQANQAGSGDAESFKLRGQLLLPRQEVCARDVELRARVLAGRGHQQSFGTPRTEPLHEPENAH